MNRVVIGLYILVSCLVARAEEGLHEAPDQSFYSKDGLFLKVALLDNPAEFLAQWKKSSVGQPPPIKTRTSFRRGETVFPAVLYSTHALSPEGKADIIYTLLFRRPDGSIYENPHDLTVADGPPPPKGVGLCKSKAGLKIENTDPFGEYTLKATITDRIKDVTVEMLFKFEVVDPEAKPPEVQVPASAPEPPEPSPTPMPTTRVRSFSDTRR